MRKFIGWIAISNIVIVIVTVSVLLAFTSKYSLRIDVTLVDRDALVTYPATYADSQGTESYNPGYVVEQSYNPGSLNCLDAHNSAEYMKDRVWRLNGVFIQDNHMYGSVIEDIDLTNPPKTVTIAMKCVELPFMSFAIPKKVRAKSGMIVSAD